MNYLERIIGSAKSHGRAQLAIASVAVLGLLGPCADVAHAAGKPEKAFLESKVHMIWPGLHSSKLSPVEAEQIHTEHARDARSLPGILRYSQSYPLPLYDKRSAYDTVTEFYSEDFARIRDAFAEEGRRSTQRSWMSRFAGGAAVGAQAWRPGGGSGLLVQDHVMVDGYEWGYKWFTFMRRKDGVSKADADAYLRDKYAAALAKLPGIRRYVIGVSYRPKDADAFWGREPAWDAVDMIWFDSLEDMQRVLGSIDYQENIQRAAEVAVVDQSKTISFAATYNETTPFAPRYDGPTWDEFWTTPK